MGEDSCSRGREFESQHRIQDRHFVHINLLQNLYYSFEKTKNKQKRVRGWSIETYIKEMLCIVIFHCSLTIHFGFGKCMVESVLTTDIVTAA